MSTNQLRLVRRVFLLEDVGGDLHEEAVEFRPSFHLPKTFGHLAGVHAQQVLHQLKYASQMSCMSMYSMPLWTILT